MNHHELYQAFAEKVQAALPSLAHWQARGLALMSFGIALSQASQVSKISEALAFAGGLATVEKRLKRWLGNPRIDIDHVCSQWVRWVWSVSQLERPILLVDETKIGDRMGVMMVSLAYDKRAIPLMWTCYPANDAQAYPAEGQVGMVVRMLEQVMASLPAHSRPLIEADRGIGCSSELIKACQARHWYYLFRIQKSSLFEPMGRSTKAVADWVQRGEVWVNYGTLFSRAARHVRSYVLLAWDAGQKEAWHLCSNDPSVENHVYAKRMWQEASFRDLKSGGWQWQTSLIETPQRMSHLILALALAYAWMLSQGTLVLHDALLQRAIGAGAVQRYSPFRAGLRFFNHSREQLERIYVGLLLVPRFAPLPETVPP